MAEERGKVVTIQNADILPGGWRNFGGKEGQFNAEGKRTFNVKLPGDIGAAMLADGFNVKELPPRDEGGPMEYRIEITVSYKIRPPQVWLIAGGAKTLLDEGSLNILDYSDIAKADAMINASRWDVNGKTGIKAYLHKLYVTLREDELDVLYNDIPVAHGQVAETPNFDGEY